MFDRILAATALNIVNLYTWNTGKPAEVIEMVKRLVLLTWGAQTSDFNHIGNMATAIIHVIRAYKGLNDEVCPIKLLQIADFIDHGWAEVREEEQRKRGIAAIKAEYESRYQATKNRKGEAVS